MLAQRAISSDVDAERPCVSVVVTTYNHRRYLAEAIESALGQTRPASEIIVVDDGSDDDPGEVVARYPSVALIRQPNAGPAAARNTGLEAATGDLIIFLDADDLLAPNAIADGVACWRAAGGPALVYGGHRRVAEDGAVIAPRCLTPAAGDVFAQLLGGNMIGMHPAVLYDRVKLQAAGGFDRALRHCEDYDVYLRLAARYPVASHGNVVADYRWHGSNTSHDHRAMRDGALAVLDRYRPPAGSALHRAWRKGRGTWRAYYAMEALSAARRSGGLGRFFRAVAMALGAPPQALVREIVRRAARPVGAHGR